MIIFLELESVIVATHLRRCLFHLFHVGKRLLLYVSLTVGKRLLLYVSLTVGKRLLLYVSLTVGKRLLLYVSLTACSTHVCNMVMLHVSVVDVVMKVTYIWHVGYSATCPDDDCS